VLHNAWAFVLLLSILVFVHELGHFLSRVRAASACSNSRSASGTRSAREMAARLAPRWHRVRDRVVPARGFVKMLGENPDEIDDPEMVAHPGESLPEKKTWQKLAIVSRDRSPT